MKANIPIEDYLKTIKDFQAKFPMAHVGGSIGLFLHGVDLQRNIAQSDIDMTIDDYLPDNTKLEFYTESSENGDFDGQFRVDVSKSLYIKIEIRVSPEPSFDVINYNGINYNVSKRRDILFWKDKYARKGVQKHIDDLIVINGGKRPLIPVFQIDDLPF